MPIARDTHLVTVRFHFSATVIPKGCRVEQHNMRVVDTLDGLVNEYREDDAPVVLRHADPVRGPVTVRRIGDGFHASVTTARDVSGAGPLGLDWLRATCLDVDRGAFLGRGHEYGARGEGLGQEALRQPAEVPAYLLKQINEGLDGLCVVDGEVLRKVHEPYVSFGRDGPTLQLDGLQGSSWQTFEWNHADWYSLDEMGLAERFEGAGATSSLTVGGDVPGMLTRMVAVQHLDVVRKMMVNVLEDADEPFFAAYVRLRALWRRICVREPGPIDVVLFEEVRREALAALPHLWRMNEQWSRDAFDKVHARLAAHAEADDTDADVLGFEAA